MEITLSRCVVICQSVAEVELTRVIPLEAVNYKFNFLNCYYRHHHHHNFKNKYVAYSSQGKHNGELDSATDWRM